MDIYLHDRDAVSDVISNLNRDIEEYKTSVTALMNLINSIDSSSAWIDKTIKTSFVSTARSYVRQYENLIKEMEILVSYLSSKNSSSSSLEDAYARG